MFKAVLGYTEVSIWSHKKVVQKKLGKLFGEFG